MQYFDLHVFYSRRNGYSIPVAIADRQSEQSFDEDEIIKLTVAQGVLDEEDASQVDMVDEITEQEYNQMKGI